MEDEASILDVPWPPDLDPETVPFRKRTLTILRRKGIWDDMTRLNEISEADVLSWVTAGVKTVVDLRDTGNAAIAAHHASAPERQRRATESQRIADKLRKLAGESWTAQVWRRDPRFRDLLARRDVTVREICLNGSSEEQRHLWSNVAELEARRSGSLRYRSAKRSRVTSKPSPVSTASASKCCWRTRVSTAGTRSSDGKRARRWV